MLYHFPFIGDKLVIGKFCAVARDVRFIMNGANHQISGFSTYPFYIFANGWELVTPQPGDFPYKGDTVIGNDVWLGYDVLVMPGVKIGDRAIVAAHLANYSLDAGKHNMATTGCGVDLGRTDDPV